MVVEYLSELDQKSGDEETKPPNFPLNAHLNNRSSLVLSLQNITKKYRYRRWKDYKGI